MQIFSWQAELDVPSASFPEVRSTPNFLGGLSETLVMAQRSRRPVFRIQNNPKFVPLTAMLPAAVPTPTKTRSRQTKTKDVESVDGV